MTSPQQKNGFLVLLFLVLSVFYIRYNLESIETRKQRVLELDKAVTQEQHSLFSSSSSSSLTIPAPPGSSSPDAAQLSQHIFNLGLPNLICIGCQKCGTTTLLSILINNNNTTGSTNDDGTTTTNPPPSAIQAASNELHFFNYHWSTNTYDNITNPNELYSIYASNWPPPQDRQTIRFEKTPKYAYDYRVPYRMKKFYNHMLPGLKLLFIIREPIERAVSGFLEDRKALDRDVAQKILEEELLQAGRVVEECHHHLAVNLTRCPASEEEEAANRELFYQCACQLLAMCDQKDTYKGRLDYVVATIDRGLYSDQIKRYLCLGFQPENILVIPFSKFTSLSSLKIIEVLEKFHHGDGIHVHNLKRLGEKVNSRTGGYTLSDEARDKLKDVYEEWNTDLEIILQNYPFWYDNTTLF